MSAPNFTPIQLYRTATAAATPSAGNLADGELAINLTDEKLYFKNASGVVKLLASNSGSLGSVTSVDASGSTTGLTFTGGPITSSGTLTLGGTLVVGNGGTGSNTAAGARTNLGVPANDGTGATGTWGISVTGNAGTVTNGVYTTGNQTIGGLKTFSSTIYLADGGFMFDSDGARDTGINWASDGVMNVRCNGVTVGQFNSTGFTGTAANVTGTVAVANGGTGATSLTSGYLLKGNGTSAVSSAVVYDNGTNVGIGTTSPTQKLDVRGELAASGLITVRGDGSEGGQLSLTNAAGSAAVYFFDVDGGGNGRLFTTVNNTNLTIGQIGGTGGAVLFATSASERMRIDTSGNVGIGTSSPTQKLTVSGGSVNADNFYIQTQGASQAGTVGFANADGPGIQFWGSSTGNAGSLTFNTASTERMRIVSGGNVGIGTTSPQARLHVRPTTDVNMWTTNDSTTLRTIAINDGVSAYINWRRDANQHTFETNGSERVRFSQTGNVGIGTTSPAQRIHAATTAASTGTTQSFLRLTGDATFGADFGGGIIQGTGPIATISTVDAGTATERMRIDSSGNVGIGTSSPDARLEVRHDQAANSFFNYYNTTAGGGVVWRQIVRNIANTGNTSADIAKLNGGAFLINNNDTDAANFTAFGVGGSERMRITSTGNVGIGTSAPNYLLHLNQNGNTQAWISATNAGSNSAGIGFENQGQRNWQIWADRTNDALQFGNNNRAATNMAIKPAGQVRFIPLASAPSGAEAGDVYYDSGTNKLRCYNGTTWNDLF